MNISDQIKLILTLSGKTQTELAQEIGVSFPALNAWVTGKSTPHKKTQDKINEIYQKYSGTKSVPEDLLTEKKKIIINLSKSYKNILKYIFANQDIYDQFLLSLTYNSNKIEGSTLTENDTAAILFHNAALSNKTMAEQLEVKNHQAALNYLFRYLLEGGIINEELILKLNAMLLNGISVDAGFYRRHGVRVVGSDLVTANYLKVPDLMENLVKSIQNDVKDVIAHASKIHAKFEQIHPFGDGNGRVGRMILTAMLLKANLPPAVIDQKSKLIYIKYLNIAQNREDYSLLEDIVCDSIFKALDILERK